MMDSAEETRQRELAEWIARLRRIIQNGPDEAQTSPVVQELKIFLNEVEAKLLKPPA
jgi:hypothetical protein